MPNPAVVLIGLCVGALGTGTVLLGGTVAALSLGPIPASTTSVGALGANGAQALGPPGTPAISPTIERAAQSAAAASCPTLDWSLLAAGTLIDPASAASLPSAATLLCPSATRTTVLGSLLGGPVEAQVALVLSHALDSDASLDTRVATALSFAAANLGAPYRWGGTGPGGFDCSGLTLTSYQAAGVTIPRVAQDQFDAGPLVPAAAVLEPGDLVFFGSGPRGVSHVGLYLGGGLMIDAPHTGAFVRIEATPTTVGAPFGSDIYVGATRPG